MIKDKLSQLRKEKGSTQQEVADYLNINRVSYAKFEGGIAEPSKETIVKLAGYFDCTTDYLLGLSDNPKEILDISDDEREFLEVYIKAKNSDKEAVQDMLKIIDKMLDSKE